MTKTVHHVAEQGVAHCLLIGTARLFAPFSPGPKISSSDRVVSMNSTGTPVLSITATR